MLQPYESIWNTLINGQSDDDYLTSKGQFTYSENIDVKNTAFEFGLTPRPVKVNFVNANINGFLPLENTSGTQKLFYYGTSGRVFNTTSVDNTPAVTLANGIEIINAIEFQDNIYFIQNSGTAVTFYKDTKVNMIAGTYAPVLFVPTVATVPSAGFSNLKALIYFDKIYIGIGKTIYTIDSVGVGTALKLFPDDIMGITTISNLLKVYLKNGSLYYLNIGDGVIEEFKPLKIIIRNVLEKGGIDYIIAGYSSSSSEFYYMDGPQLKSIKRNKKTLVNYPIGLAGTQNERYKWNFGFPIEQIQDDLLMVDKGGNYDRITHFGNKNDIFPQVFSYDYTTNSQGLKSTAINRLTYWQNNIYFFYIDGTNTGVDSIPTIPGGTTNTNGFIFTEIYDAGTRSKKKNISEIQLGCAGTDTSNELIVSYSIDGGAYITALTANDGINRKKVNIKGDFYWIQFRFELKGNAKWREFILKGNIIDNV